MARGQSPQIHQTISGSTEQPFGSVADPKYLYRSASHGRAFDGLQDAIRRRDGFVLITGDVGSGKTTVCRAVLEQLDRKTFSSLIVDPSLSEEDLLRVILKDFGLVSSDEMQRGRLAHASTHELLGTLDDFLASLRPLGAAALLVIDEAQDMPLETLDQIAALAGPAGGKENLLQIVLLGQPILTELLASPLVRELDGRITTRLALTPLTAEETAEYVSHRLTVAGAGPAAEFAPAAVALVHRYSGGVPRLINMLGDGAMLAVHGQTANSITPQLVESTAARLELRPAGTAPAAPWRRKPALLMAAGLILAVAIVAAYMSVPGGRGDVPAPAAVQVAPPGSAPAATEPSAPAATTAALSTAPAAQQPAPSVLGATVPSTGASFSVLVASFRQANEATALLTELKNRGLPVRQVRVVSSPRGVWHQVLVGPYPDAAAATRGQERVRQIRGYADAHVIPG